MTKQLFKRSAQLWDDRNTGAAPSPGRSRQSDSFYVSRQVSGEGCNRIALLHKNTLGGYLQVDSVFQNKLSELAANLTERDR